MAETFRLTVLTPSRTFLDEEVTSVIAPGSEGYLGILAHHAPLITALGPGKLTVRTTEGTQIYALSGGFLEVSENRAVILGDAIEDPAVIDVERARASAERARARLREPGKWDVDRCEAALKRALNRVKVASEPRE